MKEREEDIIKKSTYTQRLANLPPTSPFGYVDSPNSYILSTLLDVALLPLSSNSIFLTTTLSPRFTNNIPVLIPAAVFFYPTGDNVLLSVADTSFRVDNDILFPITNIPLYVHNNVFLPIADTFPRLDADLLPAAESSPFVDGDVFHPIATLLLTAVV